ncbi:MAG: hypothetical protein E6Q33_02635 [Neisseriales bacterium]|nr:MAG: hypothetical protein E6Q33_02635 [Neisseriales bacterium]
MEALNYLICKNYARPPSVRQPDEPIPQSGIVGINWNSVYKGWQVFKKSKYIGKAKTLAEAKEIMRRAKK